MHKRQDLGLIHGSGSALAPFGSQPAAGAPAPLACLLVEDQAMFLDLLAATLDQIAGLQVVARAATAAAAVAAAESLRPQLLILDLDLPDAPGTVVAEALLRCNPTARLIVLSGQASSFVCPPALEPMLHAVVDKTNAYQELRQELASLLPAAGNASSALERLSPRERQILRLIGEGMSSKRIAAQLAISTDTVQTHRRHIASKLGMAGAELIRTAVLFCSGPLGQTVGPGEDPVGGSQGIQAARAAVEP